MNSKIKRSAGEVKFNMRVFAVIFSGLLALASLPASALVVYVDKDATGAGTGTSWADAFTAIQPAVDAAAAGGGGEVWVAEGVYTSTQSPVVSIHENVAVYGGFSGTEAFLGQREWDQHATTIDGQSVRRCIIGANASIIDGMTITRGSGIDGNYGGGILNAGTSPVIRNCKIALNNAVWGGGICNIGAASPIITNCVFSSNTTSLFGSGGGIANLSNSSPQIANCIFRNNMSSNGGGGVANDSGCTPSISKCFFASNTASICGGAISNWQSVPDIENCVFEQNSSGNYGGAIYNGSISNSALSYCTLSRNTSGYGGGVFNDCSSPFIANCIIWDNNGLGSSIFNIDNVSCPANPIVDYSCIQGGYGGTGNIDLNPLFTSPLTGDYHLPSGSPCIDTGTSSGAPSTDIDGNFRPQGGGYDMGAYEGSGAFDWVEISNAAPWSGRSDMGVVVFDDKMWLMGGWDGAERHGDVWSSTDGQTWVPVTPAAPWTPRSAHSVVSFNGEMWILGGMDDGGVFLNEVWHSSDGQNWSQVSTPIPWAPRARHEALIHDGKIWILGGATGELLQANDVWNSPDGVNWNLVTPSASWIKRDHHVCAVHENTLWLMGGYGIGVGQLNDVWSSVDGSDWDAATLSAPWPRCEAANAVSFQKQLWIYGLGDSTVWATITGDHWWEVKTSHIWPARSAAGAVVFDDRMWIFGGYGGPGIFRNDVWATTGKISGRKGYEYTYDTVSRLTAVTPNNGVHITYAYDAAGNRLQKRVYSDVAVSEGPANPASGGVENSAVDRPMLQLSLSCEASDTVTLQSVAFSTSGSGDESSAISGAKLWLDANGDGLVDGGDTQLGSTMAVAANDGELVFGGLNRPLAAGAPVHLLATYTLNGTAGQGQTFSLSLPDASGVRGGYGDTGLAVTPLGNGVTGATVTVSTDTVVPVFAGLVSAVGGNGSAVLAWDAATDTTPPVGYGIWVSTAPFGGVVSGPPAFTTTGLSHTVPHLVNGVEYFFVVRAEDAAGNRETNTVERSAYPEGVYRALTVTADANGTVSGGSELPYEDGAPVFLLAQPDAGYVFSGWSGDIPAGQASANPLGLVMDMDRAVTAQFTRATGTVVVNVNTPLAPWTVTDGDGTPVSGTGPATLSTVPTGDVSLSWGGLAGHREPPAAEQRVLSQGGAVLFSGSYAPLVAFAAALPSLRLYTGDSLLLDASAQGGLGQLHYRWLFESGKAEPALVGGDASVLSVPVIQPAQAGVYLCEVTDSTLTVYPTNTALVEVENHLAVTKEPLGESVVAGNAFTLFVETSGGYEPLTHQWRKDGANIAGATSASLELDPLKTTDSGDYMVEVSDANGDTIESATATLNVDAGLPAVKSSWLLMFALVLAAVMLAVGYPIRKIRQKVR